MEGERKEEEVEEALHQVGVLELMKLALLDEAEITRIAQQPSGNITMNQIKG